MSMPRYPMGWSLRRLRRQVRGRDPYGGPAELEAVYRQLSADPAFQRELTKTWRDHSGVLPAV